MPLILNSRFRLRIVCFFQDQLGLNIKYGSIVGGSDLPVAEETVAEQLAIALAPLYGACLSASAQFIGVGLTKLDGISAEVFDRNHELAGSITGDPLPRQVSGLITLRSGLAGRANRGRVYVPFPGESSNVATGFAVPAPSYRDSLADIGTYMIDPEVEVGADEGDALMRFELPNAKGFSSFVVREGWATQRRRGFFGRRNLTP